MTMVKAACCIIDDLVESGSFLRTQVSASDFGIMDNMPACAIVLRPSQTTLNRVAYGNIPEIFWGFQALCYLQDTGDVEETLGNIIQIHDSFERAIRSGCFANCGSLTTWVNGLSHNWNDIYNFGGPDYFLVTAAVVSREDA